MSMPGDGVDDGWVNDMLYCIVYLLHHCRKLFVGGLSWETDDGKLVPLCSISLSHIRPLQRN